MPSTTHIGDSCTKITSSLALYPDGRCRIYHLVCDGQGDEALHASQYFILPQKEGSQVAVTCAQMLQTADQSFRSMLEGNGTIVDDVYTEAEAESARTNLLQKMKIENSNVKIILSANIDPPTHSTVCGAWLGLGYRSTMATHIVEQMLIYSSYLPANGSVVRDARPFTPTEEQAWWTGRSETHVHTIFADGIKESEKELEDMLRLSTQVKSRVLLAIQKVQYSFQRSYRGEASVTKSVLTDEEKEACYRRFLESCSERTPGASQSSSARFYADILKNHSNALVLDDAFTRGRVLHEQKTSQTSQVESIASSRSGSVLTRPSAAHLRNRRNGDR